MIVLPNESKTFGHTWMLNRQQITALPSNQSRSGNADGGGRSAFAAHQFVQQFRAAIAKGLKVRIDAGNGRVHRVGCEEIIFRTHDGNALGNRSEERRVGKECRSRWSP